jgi:hypothetical protein
MPPEKNEIPQFSDDPVNLFEEPRDHANQWDVSVLWPDSKAPVRDDEEE